MRRREFITLLGGVAVAWPIVARAQKVYIIGIFSAGLGSPKLLAAFTEGLRKLGWVEGKNIVFEHRYAENRLDRLPELAAGLGGLNVAVTLAWATPAPPATHGATSPNP